jgi:hypothetical protein
MRMMSSTDLAAVQGRPPRMEELVEHAATLDRDAGLAALTDADVEQRLVTQTVQIAAATSRWLDLVAEVVVRGIWADHGARNPAAWLSWRLGIAPSTAREQIRVALRLRELPLIHARFATGALSYSKVRALTRIAVPELEELLLTWADQATGADLDRIAKGVVQARRAASSERSEGAEQPAARPGLDVLIGDDGEVEVRWQLDATDGMEVLAILDRLVELEDEAEGGDGSGSGEVAVAGNAGGTAAARRATGSVRQRQGELLLNLLVAARDTTPADTSGADRHTLVVQVDADQLAADPARRVPIEVAGHRRARPTMSAAVLRRLACDAGVVLVPTSSGRTPIDVGRRRRRPTASLRRALNVRDRSCRFPGCGTTRHLHAHHVVHWADDGPTDLSNLVLLCGSHHRQIHEPGWQLTWGSDSALVVRPPGRDGRTAPALAAAPGLESEWRSPGDTTTAATGARDPNASAEAFQAPAGIDALTPDHWADDDPLQLDLLIAILHQELARTNAGALAQVA